jgi:predicted dehydrogenase/threonine dehydrogenase-like Zn-dependent dehydrogenase
MLAEFGRAGLLGKAIQQPERLAQVFQSVKTNGLIQTLDSVFSKLNQPIAVGYSNVGTVLMSESAQFSVGDRVVSNGCHAEVVRVPKNLCARVPDNVDTESASFTVIASIALQGIRLASPTIGELFVVQGLGLVGLLTVQMLRANGCRVLGIDYHTARCSLARQFGAEVIDLSKSEDPIAVAQGLSRGRGVDGVMICTATKSNLVIQQAAEMCRKRARIVLIGVAGLTLKRDCFYKKELSFQVSASYGPGRYDPEYEDKGNDYPFGFVRWTQQRNFEAVLDMMAAGTLNVKPLITHRFAIYDAVKAYELLGDASALGIMIKYPRGDIHDRTVVIERRSEAPTQRSIALQSTPVISFIGAGNYASRILIPAFKQANVELDTIAGSTGVSCVHHGRKAGFAQATTDLNLIWTSQRINTVVIATRHNAHALQVIAALKAGKHVFVEKPLCLTLEELDGIRSALTARSSQADEPVHPILMVGFNRRFSPHIQKIKQLLNTVIAPKSLIMTVNAGAIPPDHWTQDPHSGGDRIIGEACHFIDLLRFLVDAPIAEFDLSYMASSTRDTATITLKFADGSVGTIHYFSNGSKSFPKERLEVFTAGRVLALDNFRKLTGYGWPGFSKMNRWSQDKGQVACVRAFVDSIHQGEESAGPIPLAEIFEVAEVTIKLVS